MSATKRARELTLTLTLCVLMAQTDAVAEAQATPIAPPPEQAEPVATPIAGPPVDPGSVDVVAVEAAEVGAEPGETAEPESPLPSGEEELMDHHSVAIERIRFSPGSGLDVRSEDDAFRLQIRVRGQMLYTVTDTSGDLQHQFTARRLRAVFAGHFFSPDNRYKLELAFSPQDEGIRDNLSEGSAPLTPLLDFYFEFRQLRDLSLRIGQYKLPGNRQRVISSGDLQMVDRSLVNGVFNLDRDLGIDLRSADFLGLGLLRYYAGASIGRGRDATGFGSFGMHYFARVEVLPFGMFDDYEESDFERSRTPRLSIGATYSFQHRNPGLRQIATTIPADGGTTDYHVFFADAIFKYAGFSAQWEFAVREGQRNPGGAVDDMGNPVPVTPAHNGWGTMIQAGYLLPRTRFEVSGRYGLVRRIGSAVESAAPDQTELGVGLSYYFAHHSFKLQADYFRLWGLPGTLDDGANQVRVQFQGAL